MARQCRAILGGDTGDMEGDDGLLAFGAEKDGGKHPVNHV